MHLGVFDGINYRPSYPEPHTSLPQALLAAIVMACFAVGVLCVAAGCVL